MSYFRKPLTDNYGLPELLHIQLDDIFHLKREDWSDPCPHKANFNGLKVSWGDYNKVNCPFSTWKLWMAKCREEQIKGKTSVAILPATKMSSPDFHEIVLENGYLMILNGRPTFINLNDLQKKLNQIPIPILICVFYGKGKEKNYHKQPIFGTDLGYRRYKQRTQKEREAIANFMYSKRNRTLGLWRISKKGDIERKCSICKEWVLLSEEFWTYNGNRFKAHSKCVWTKKKNGFWKV